MHKRKITIVSSAGGDEIYVLFVNDHGYIRRKSSWVNKPRNVSYSCDYYDALVESARKMA